ncbi:MAG: hypothetical protein KKF44_03660, partial [Nanoarchaeota archaeon]|nr:hypothetical protein [Nanoarchaeota archaeon]
IDYYPICNDENDYYIEPIGEYPCRSGELMSLDSDGMICNPFTGKLMLPGVDSYNPEPQYFCKGYYENIPLCHGDQQMYARYCDYGEIPDFMYDSASVLRELTDEEAWFNCVPKAGQNKLYKIVTEEPLELFRESTCTDDYYMECKNLKDSALCWTESKLLMIADENNEVCEPYYGRFMGVGAFCGEADKEYEHDFREETDQCYKDQELVSMFCGKPWSPIREGLEFKKIDHVVKKYDESRFKCLSYDSGLTYEVVYNQP